MNPTKLARVWDWPIPQTLRQLQSWLGFLNFYRRFIKDFAKEMKPLTILTKKGVPFKMGPEQIAAFNKGKKIMLKKPVLILPNEEEPFFLETNASAYASGGVLMQKDQDGQLHPCGFISKMINSAEQNYPIYDRELLAVIHGLRAWRPLLEYSTHEVTLFTDHQNLQYFRSAQDLN